MNNPRQQTVARSGEVAGVGLHTGTAVRMRLLPADVGHGVVFRRIDLADSPEVTADVGNVVSTDRGTTLGKAEVRVQTVEHLLSALAGNGIDNVIVELDGAEPPAGDGSARLFNDLVDGCGAREQEAQARVLSLDAPFTVSEGAAEYVVAPADEYRVTTTIDFDHPLIRRQAGSFRITPRAYAEELCPARTFGFAHEVEDLRRRGLAIGGTPENAIVLTAEGVLDDVALRFPDEFVRHKTLDLVGDLALLGGRLRAQIVAEQPGHRGNIALAREIAARTEPRKAGPILDVQQILQYLPHRYPLLLVDRVIEYEQRRRIVGIKNVTINEPFFVGHFPGHPIMPGVLIIEAMAQVGGLLMLDTIDNPAEKIVYFMSLDKVKWRRPVIPGDQIRFELEVRQIRGHTCRMRGVGTVEGQTVAEAEMMARVVDR